MLKDKLINRCKNRVLARAVIDTIWRLEQDGRLGPHKRLSTALARKSYKKLAPVVDSCIEESLYGVMAETYDTYPEITLQQQIKSYQQNSNNFPVEKEYELMDR